MFRSGFFDSTSVIANPEGYPQGNKAESADFFAAFWASIIGDGIPYYPTSNLLVTPKTGMTVEVQPGKAYKNAYMAWDEAATEITIDTSAEARTLYIGIRLNETDGEFTGGIAARAAFDSDSDVVFAKLTIPANAVVVTNAMIEDTRSNATYCGYVNDIETRLADLEQELREQIAIMIAGGVPHHASTHATGGADALTPASIGAAEEAHTHTPASIGTAPALQSNVTYYVAAAGNDVTGNGTELSPFASVDKALSLIPKNLNGFSAEIQISAGTYAQGFRITGYYGGLLVLKGAYTTANVPQVIFQSRNSERYIATYCSATVCLRFFAINTTYSRGLEISGMSTLLLDGVHVVNGLSYKAGWLISIANSSVSIPYREDAWCVKCTNGDNGVTVFTGALRAYQRIGGSGNNVGIACHSGVVQTLAPAAAFATTLYATTNGGRIFAGAQTSMPNY